MALDWMILEFEPWHLACIKPQEAQEGVFRYADTSLGSIELYGHALLAMAAPEGEGRCAWSAMVEGRILACGGIVRKHPHLGEAWMVFDQDFFICPAQVIRGVLDRIKAALDACPFRRVQATTESGFQRGDRFLRKLGFQPEGRLRAYGHDGQDHIIYGIVK